MPQPVAQTVGALADAGCPAQAPTHPAGDYLPVAALKLFLHPLLAERFGADNGRIARIFLVSTAAACVTFSLAVSWLG